MSDKLIIWMGTSKDDISAMPSPVKASFGHRLRLIQKGKPVMNAKALAQFGPGVFELRDGFDGEAYRLMYVNLRSAIYVLHAFQKKSKSGIGLPRPDMELITSRLKLARALGGGLN